MEILEKLMFLLIIGLIGALVFLPPVACENSAKQNEVEYRFSYLGGCSYKHPTTGLWVPRKNYRAVGD